MDAMLGQPQATRPKLLVKLGSGASGTARLPSMFSSRRELRVALDPAVAPDLVADMTELSAIETASADALWSAHCLEHLHLFQVTKAIAEAHRVLRDDGFLCLVVPDLQAVAEYIASDRLRRWSTNLPPVR